MFIQERGVTGNYMADLKGSAETFIAECKDEECRELEIEFG